MPAVHAWVETNLPPARGADHRRSARWAAAGSWPSPSPLLGLLALSRGRRDLALLLALGTLAFPMEWALKYFVSPEADQPSGSW